MKNFFTIVFGGLAVFFICLSVIRISDYVPRPSPIALHPVLITASEEEDTDVIDSAAQALHTSTTTVSAKSYIVRDVLHNKIVLEHDAERLMPIASLTKLVTAVVSRKLNDPNTKITVGPKIMMTYGNTAGFKEGETFTANDLLYPLLMVSSNDAAEALARAYDRKRFIQAMNDFTQSIGAYRTYFSDPAGLSPDNVASADDMAHIIEWISVNDPGIIDITRLKSKSVRAHTWENPTHFLSWSYYRGGKNGYLPESDRTSAALFTLKDGAKGAVEDTYSVVVLGSKTRDADVVSLLEQAKAL